MKTTPKFYGTPIDGKMAIVNLTEWERFLRTLNGQKCEINVKKFRKKRTNPQNRYYFGVVVKILADHWGYTHDEAHKAIAYEFLSKKEDGKPSTVRSTKSLNTADFAEYIEAVKKWAAVEWGCYIPDAE